MKDRHLILLPFKSVKAQNVKFSFTKVAIDDVLTQWKNVKGIGLIGEPSVLYNQSLVSINRTIR